MLSDAHTCTQNEHNTNAHTKKPHEMRTTPTHTCTNRKWGRVKSAVENVDLNGAFMTERIGYGILGTVAATGELAGRVNV